MGVFSFLKFVLCIVAVSLCCLQGIHSNPIDPSIKPEPRIVNGTVATLAGTKHQASIRLRANDFVFGNGHICGGSVISPKKVLTAAHCVYDDDKKRFRSAREFSVVVGTLNRLVRTKDTLTFRVTKVAYPKKFNIDTLVDDIAVFFLDGEIPANHTTVQPIEMYSANDTDLVKGAVCQVTGWGTTQEKGVLTNQLMTADLPIVSRTTCNLAYANSLTKGMMCAGYMSGMKDACQGDSGGPLVCNSKLAGVVSWGMGCARTGFPGVYTNVSYYRDWVQAQKGSAGGLRSSVIGMLAIVAFNLFN